MRFADIEPVIGASTYAVTYGGAGIPGFIDNHRAETGIELDPDFQRGHVWPSAFRSRYVEHLLRGGTHGRDIVWNSPLQGHAVADSDLGTATVLVDGKQRLTSVLMFLDDEVAVFGGHRLSDFDPGSQELIRRRRGPISLVMNVHGLQHRRELLRLYLELNEGSVAHSPDEIARVRSLLEAEKAA